MAPDYPERGDAPPREIHVEAAPRGLDGIGAELGALMGDIGSLVRSEARLAVQEVVDGIKAMQAGVTLAAIGAVVALVGAVVLLVGLITALAILIGSTFWALIIVGVVAAVAGYLMMQAGVAKLKHARLKPEAALRGLEKDVQAVTGKMTASERHGA